MISDKHFLKFKELTREDLGEEKYSKMTEQELFASFTALITLMETVYQYNNRKNKDDIAQRV